MTVCSYLLAFFSDGLRFLLQSSPRPPPIFFPFAPLSLFWLRSAVPEQAPHLATRTAKAVREHKLWPRDAAGFAGHENKHNLFTYIHAKSLAAGRLPEAGGRLPLAVCGPSIKVAPVVLLPQYVILWPHQ